MPGRNRRILGAAVAAALGTALPAHAAARLGGADDDRLGAVLDEIFATNAGGLFDQTAGADDRTEQAARLCLHPADKVRLRADMSADYDRDRRSVEIECEVDFKGHNEVTAFRQVGEASGGSFDNVLRDLLGQ